jgi:DNA repair exonuclease SbcCD ATPase subunit
VASYEEFTSMEISLARNEPHVHVNEDRCPLCDQPIPNDKAEEVRRRWEHVQASSDQIAKAVDKATKDLRQQIDQLNESVKNAESEKNEAVEQGLAKLKEAYNEGM